MLTLDYADLLELLNGKTPLLEEREFVSEQIVRSLDFIVKDGFTALVSQQRIFF